MEFPNIDRKRLKSYPIKENKKMVFSDDFSQFNQKENNDFCPHCLRGNIKIFPVLKRYNILINNTSYILEYIKNEGEREYWKIYDAWKGELIDRAALKAALIKKVNEENI